MNFTLLPDQIELCIELLQYMVFILCLQTGLTFILLMVVSSKK